MLTLLPSAFACLLAACPSTDPAPPRIERVNVIRFNASWTELELQILGHGFGPTSIQYDLSSGVGMATTQARMEIFDQAGLARIAVPREQLTVMSPREIDARVVLSSALQRGTYGVRLFSGEGTKPIAELAVAFRAEATEPADPNPDAGAIVEPANGPDGGVLREDALEGQDRVVVQPDAESSDLLAPDSTSRPDSGLGAFVLDYRYRQKARITNASAAVIAAGPTFRVPIPHRTLVMAGRSRADGTDLALYLGVTSVDYAWDDPLKLNTDQLVMIARMPVAVPQGSPDFPLVLYYGDPNARVRPTDAVFAFTEHFAADLPGGWATNNWTRCNRARPLDTATAPGMGRAYCAVDNMRQLSRHTLASPTLPSLVSTRPANEIYEASFWIAGLMTSQTNDLVYFAHGPSATTNYQLTTVLAPNRYVEYPPNVAAFTFPEVPNNQPRTVPGWRLPAALQTWTRARARFVLTASNPSLQLRFISTDNVANPATFVAITDLTVRVAAEPELGVVLDAVEAR